MRAVISLLFALLLAVTSVTFAAARVQEIGATQMVICAQGAARLVTLDAAGNPIEVPHHCPDCLAALPPVPSPVTLPGRPTSPRLVLLPPAQAQIPPQGAARSPWARGPPVLV